MLRVNLAPKFARCLSSTASEAVRTVPYLEYARSARQDVAEVMRQLEGSHSERLHGLSSMALDIWPKESPQWRLAGEVVPQEIEAKALQQELSDEGTSGEARAAMLRVLCGIRSRPSLRLAESVAKDALVWKINLQELCRCIAALADSGWHPMPKDSSLMIFAKEGLQRLAAGAKLLEGKLRVSRGWLEGPQIEALEQLLTSHRAALALNLQSSASGLTSELRKRVLRATWLQGLPGFRVADLFIPKNPGVQWATYLLETARCLGNMGPVPTSATAFFEVVRNEKSLGCKDGSQGGIGQI
ncbi:unnamed protein product [Cladocopium goreaui]|uniref:Uncharacterized protein n=1 Tax=Cladocopium goreaui TaxID=2562237 RepID=A0A9P1CYJ2_9DINO|nr:unnamed protein product [Cladocopium goreaui]